MGIVIGETRMVSDQTGHTATRTDDGTWASTRVPGRLLDRNTAISSLVLAELESAGYANSPHARQLRAEVGLDAPPPPDEAA